MDSIAIEKCLEKTDKENLEFVFTPVHLSTSERLHATNPKKSNYVLKKQIKKEKLIIPFETLTARIITSSSPQMQNNLISIFEQCVERKIYLTQQRINNFSSIQNLVSVDKGQSIAETNRRMSVQIMVSRPVILFGFLQSILKDVYNWENFSQIQSWGFASLQNATEWLKNFKCRQWISLNKTKLLFQFT